MSWRVLEGDVRDGLSELDDESVQTCVTSPPYWGLRDYGTDGQLGLEPTPEEYVANMVAVFREVRRVLRDDGTLWLNLGDSYATHAAGMPLSGDPMATSTLTGLRTATHSNTTARKRSDREKRGGLPEKNLIGIPWRVAFALQADGWWLRSDIIWAKPNPMPESVTDRPTRSHEYLFLLTKSARYFYDAHSIREDDLGTDHVRSVLHRPEPSGGVMGPHNGIRRAEGRNGMGRNKRSVWTVTTQPYAEAHFATFPPKLIEPCILAGSPPKCCGECGAPWERVVRAVASSEGRQNWAGQAASKDGASRKGGFYDAERETKGWRATCSHDDDSGRSVVLDPFCGSGTTGLVALRHDRSFVGIELNPDYCELARNRIRDDAPLLNAQLEVEAGVGGEQRVSAGRGRERG